MFLRGRPVRRRRLMLTGLLGVVPLVLASCGSGAATTTASGKPSKVIRFVLSPDPVWDYLNASGIRQQMEQQSGFRIVDSSTWDEYGIYASGNADIISAASFEVPGLIAATRRPSVIFGKYNTDRSVLLVSAKSTAKSLADLKGKKIASYSTQGSTLLWEAYAKKYENLTLKPGGGDFKFVVSDAQQEASLVTRGDVAACICLPEFAIKELRTGQLKPLYQGAPISQLFGQRLWPSGHEGPMLNSFVAPADWAKTNPQALKFFLSLWQKGVDAWRKNPAVIIKQNPDDFAVTNSTQDIPWLLNYMKSNDWFVKRVALSPTWIQQEKQLYPVLKSAGVMPKSQQAPGFVATAAG